MTEAWNRRSGDGARSPRRRLRARAAVALAATALAGLLGGSCLERAVIVAPADLSTIPADGEVVVEIDLGAPVEAPGSVGARLLSGIDFGPARITDLDDRVVRDGRDATLPLGPDDLSPGRNTVFVRIDRNGDGHPETALSTTFTWEASLRAAACKRVITPVVGVNHTDPIYLAGFGTRTANGVHDDLWARGVVLESRGRKIALVTLDLIGYFNNEIQTIRSLVDPARGFDAITVTSTHQHEGPDTMGLWGPNEITSGVDLGYLDFVNQSVADCIEEADDALAPAEIRFATGSTVGTSLPPEPDLVADGEILRELTVPFFIVDPNDPFKPAPPGLPPLEVEGDPGPIRNPSVPVFQVRGRDGGAVMATLVNYASHPESLGSSNRLITSDFPHYMREWLEARYGGTAIYLSADLGVLQGPLDVDVADPVTGEPVPRRSFEFAQVMGEILAERAASALDTAGPWDAAPPLRVEQTGPFALKVENPYFIVFGTQGVFGRRGFTTLPDGTRTIETEVQAIRIGDAQIAVTPNELDPQIGNDYRARMTHADHRFVAGLGNDELGYQMPVAKFNPTCHQCWGFVVQGLEDQCPLAATLDCGTVFINNIGGNADPTLQGHMQELLDALNP